MGSMISLRPPPSPLDNLHVQEVGVAPTVPPPQMRSSPSDAEGNIGLEAVPDHRVHELLFEHSVLKKE